MSSITRHIIAVDMLSQELSEAAEVTATTPSNSPSTEYFKLLAQFSQRMHVLAKTSEDETEKSFALAMAKSHTCKHIKTKQMLMIHCRLLDFVLDFYHADNKANQLLDSEFGTLADQRLDLLQTRAIKARAQQRTVAQALGKSDYQAFVEHASLPIQEWDWEALRIN